MPNTDRSLDLLVLLRKGASGGDPQNSTQNSGGNLYIVRCITAEPEITLAFEGTDLPIGTDIFEIPIRFLPIEEGARYFALPIIGGQRWGLLEKIDGEEITDSFLTGDNRTVEVKNGIVKEIK